MVIYRYGKESKAKQKGDTMSEFNHEVKTNTSMISFVYQGTYGTYLGELLDCVKPSDRDKCQDDIAVDYLDMLYDVLTDIMPSGVSGSFTLCYDGMYHPCSYNFETDSIEYTIKFTDDFKSYFARYANDNKKSFDRFLHDNFTSRDGFYSFTPNNFDEWLDGFNNDDARCVSVLITYYLNNEGGDENDDVCWFYENIDELIAEGYIPWDYAVKYHNGYVGYCVSNWDEDKYADRYDAYLFDVDGNLVNTATMYDEYELHQSAYLGYDCMEYNITNHHEHVGYEYDEMDIAEFHKLYGDKIDHKEF